MFLLPSEPVQRIVRPSELERFIVDVPSSGSCRLRVRMDRRGGDPVLMASCGEWPSVDLDRAADDLVRAHYCAFQDFQADAASHELLITSAGMPRPPKPMRLRARSGEGAAEFPVAPAGHTRWAVCVFNFPLSRCERSSVQLVAYVEPEGNFAVGRQLALPAAPLLNVPGIGTRLPPPMPSEPPPPQASFALQTLREGDIGADALGEIEARFLALARADCRGGCGDAGGGGSASAHGERGRGMDGAGGGDGWSCASHAPNGPHSPADVLPARRALAPAFSAAAAGPLPHNDNRAAASSTHDFYSRPDALAAGLFCGGLARCRRGAVVIRALMALVGGTRGGREGCAKALFMWRYAVAAMAAQAAFAAGIECDRRHNELESRRGELGSRAAELVERAAELDVQASELESRRLELERHKSELGSHASVLGLKATELDSRSSELDRRVSELDSRASGLDSRASELDSRACELEVQSSELEQAVDAAHQAMIAWGLQAESEGTRQDLEQEVAAAVAAAVAGEEAAAAAAVEATAAAEGVAAAAVQARAAAEAIAVEMAAAMAEARADAFRARAEAATAQAAAVTAEAKTAAALRQLAAGGACSDTSTVSGSSSQSYLNSCSQSYSNFCSQLALSDGREDLRSQLADVRSQLAMARQREEHLRSQRSQALGAGARGMGAGQGSNRIRATPITASMNTLSTPSPSSLTAATASAATRCGTAPTRAATSPRASTPSRASTLADCAATTRPRPSAPTRAAVSARLSVRCLVGFPAESIPAALAAADAALTCLAAALREADDAASAAALGRRDADARAAAAESTAEAAAVEVEEARAELYQAQARAEAEAAAAAEEMDLAISEARREWSDDDVRLEILNLRRELRTAKSSQRAAISVQRESEIEAAAAMEAARALAAAHAEARMRVDVLGRELRWAETQAAGAAAALDSTRKSIKQSEVVAAATRQAAEELQAENSRQRRALDRLQGEVRRLAKALEKGAAREARLSLALEAMRRKVEMSDAERCAAAERSLTAWCAAPAAGMLARAVEDISPPRVPAHPRLLSPHAPPGRPSVAVSQCAQGDHAPSPNFALNGAHSHHMTNGAHPHGIDNGSCCTTSGPHPHYAANGAHLYATDQRTGGPHPCRTSNGAHPSTSCTSPPPRAGPSASNNGTPCTPTYALPGTSPQQTAQQGGGGWMGARERAAAVSIALRGGPHPPHPSTPTPCVGGSGGGGAEAPRLPHAQSNSCGGAGTEVGSAFVAWPAAAAAHPVEPRLPSDALQADTDALLQIARAVRSLEENIAGSPADAAGETASGERAPNTGGGGGSLDTRGGGSRFQLQALFRIEQTGSPYQRACAREELSRWGQARRAEAVRVQRAWSVGREWKPLSRALFTWARVAGVNAGVNAVAMPLRRGRAVWRWRAVALALELRDTNGTLLQLSEDMAVERAEAVAAAALASVAADDAAARAVRASFQRWEVERSRMLDLSAAEGATAAAEAARRVEKRLAALALLSAAAVNTAGGHYTDLLQVWLQRWRLAVLSEALASAAATIAKASRRAAKFKQALADATVHRLQFARLLCRGLQMRYGVGRALERWRAITRISRFLSSTLNPPPPQPARPPPPPPSGPPQPSVPSTCAAVGGPERAAARGDGRPPPILPRCSSSALSMEDVAGDVTGDVSMEVTGDVSMDVSGDVSMDVSGDMSRDVSWDVSREVCRDVSGDVSGDVSRDVSRNVSRDLSGDVSRNASADTATRPGWHSGNPLARGAYPGSAHPGDVLQEVAAEGMWPTHCTTPHQPFPALSTAEKTSPPSSPAASPLRVPSPGTSPLASPPRARSPLHSPVRGTSFTLPPHPLFSHRNSTASILSSAPPLLTGASSCFLDAEAHASVANPPPYWTVTAAVAAARAMERAMPPLSPNHDAICMAAALCMWRGFVIGAAAGQAAAPARTGRAAAAAAMAKRLFTLDAVNAERAARALAVWWAAAALMRQQVAHIAARRRAIEATARATAANAAPPQHAGTAPAPHANLW